MVQAPGVPASRHPLSRWYVVGPAARVARWLSSSWVRPTHLTLTGLLAAGGAAGVLLVWPAGSPWAALLVLVSWFFDRADGLLARHQGTTSAWGAWLDANVDELVDVVLHVAVAAAAARLTGSQLPWLLLAAFLAGKYLFFHGLASETESVGGTDDFPNRPEADATSLAENRRCHPRKPNGLLRRLYHLPGNTDVRVHLLVVALLTGYLTAELALVAVYYNLRWLVRYVLVARRLGGTR